MLPFTMNEFKTILMKLKHIISQQLQSNKKVTDKTVELALEIKPSTLASHKRRDKLPYQAILTYCHQNRLDVRKILFDDNAIICYPPQVPTEDGKVRVRYFRSLDAYSHYLRRHEEV